MMRARWETTRTEAFSDGVFAIAITLLVLEIDVPESELAHLWHAIAEQWPSYLAYVTSFLTIGGLWLAHHSIFRRIHYANTSVMRINLGLLMAVSFLPFPTRLVAESLKHTESSERAAVIFCGAALLVISILFSALWRAVARDRQLLRPEVSDEEVAAIGRAASPDIPFYLVVIVLAILAPRIAAFGYLAVALLGVMRARSDTSTKEPE
jgi:uncharacterized membrane protein